VQYVVGSADVNAAATDRLCSQSARCLLHSEEGSIQKLNICNASTFCRKRAVCQYTGRMALAGKYDQGIGCEWHGAMFGNRDWMA